MTKKKNNHSDKHEPELLARMEELNGQLFALRNELAMNKKLDKPHLIKAYRKEKAQILTRITQLKISKGVA